MENQNAGPRGRRDLLDKVPQSDEFERLLAETGGDQFAPVAAGEKVKGRIVSIGTEAVLVDIGQRSEGVVPIESFAPEERESLAVGQESEFHVTKVGGGGIELARVATAKTLDLESMADAMRSGLPIEGRVSGENKGGFSVDLTGGKGFVPFSQMELGPAQPAAEYVGRTFRFRVLEIRGKDVILSRSSLLREERDAERKAFVGQLAEGQGLDAVVIKHERFGIFVDIGAGVHALVPASEITWSRGGDALKDAPSIGTTVHVKIIKIEEGKDRPRISASLKQVSSDPWSAAGSTFTVGAKVTGKVTRLAAFGAFVELAPGIEGLLHVSEIASNKRLQHPSEAVRPGQALEVTITAVDGGARRISLSTKGPAADALDEETRAKFLGNAPKSEAGNAFGSQLADALKRIKKS